MPDAIITLAPNVGDELPLTGDNYSVGMELDWGEHTIDPQLASGSDVVGGVPGTRMRSPTEATIPVRVHAETSSDYVLAAEELANTASRLARYGGFVRAQVDFGSGDLSEETQAIVYTCNLDPEGGWFEAHKKTAVVTLAITRDPTWVSTTAETLATQTSQTGASITTAYEARGNLPGPAVLEMDNPIATARRYWELGVATTQYQAADSYHYSAPAFTAGAATLDTSDTDAIATDALDLYPVLPSPQVIGTLSNLTHVGTYAVSVRAKGSNETAQQYIRVLWRQSGGGPWREIGSAAVPGDASQYWHVPVGTLRNYNATTAPGTDSIDIRVDGYADDTGGPTLSLDTLFLVPAELHVVARGIEIEQPPLAVDIFDSFSDEAADVVVANTIAPTGGTWTIQGDTTGTWFARGGGV